MGEAVKADIERLSRIVSNYHSGPGYPNWRFHEPVVRAILQALREPSEGMLRAYDGGSAGASAEYDLAIVVEGWHVMIDHLLDESA